ncbi:MAG: amidase [Candidatus Methylomirabilales bacterium]
MTVPTAVEAAEAVREGRLTSEQLVRSCLERIAAREATVQAWAYLDPEHALAQARAADRARREGRSLGPLHGVPVGVKDVFDTADMPTEDGTVLHAGRQPVEDAFAVALMRQAGAVILGKTVCTELGLVAPGKTRNPHDPGRTPGGSSSGSAAAVADGMVPLAVGSQNNGSVIRPASYCGVYGFKPTAGRLSRTGVLTQSPSLDQLGVFAATLPDAARLAEALMAFDPRDPAMRPAARPALSAALAEGFPRRPRIAVVQSPVWEQASPTCQQALRDLAKALGDAAAAAELPADFAQAHAVHKTIMEPELAQHYAGEYARGKERLSPTLREIIERGQQSRTVDYNRARAQAAALTRSLDAFFADWDAILTPATMDAAPEGLASTGSPVFCTIWTLCGTPAISLPILRGAAGLPLGAQLVAARGCDARLLQVAQWILRAVGR